MNLLEALRLALGILWANRLRTFLTILGNVVAVSSVVAVVAIIDGLNRYVSDQVLSTGSQVFTISKFGFESDYDTYLKMLRRKDLTIADADALGRQMQNASAVVPVVSRRETLRVGRSQATGASIVGLGDGYPELRTLDLAEGRHLATGGHPRARGGGGDRRSSPGEALRSHRPDRAGDSRGPASFPDRRRVEEAGERCSGSPRTTSFAYR